MCPRRKQTFQCGGFAEVTSIKTWRAEEFASALIAAGICQLTERNPESVERKMGLWSAPA